MTSHDPGLRSVGQDVLALCDILQRSATDPALPVNHREICAELISRARLLATAIRLGSVVCRRCANVLLSPEQTLGLCDGCLEAVTAPKPVLNTPAAGALSGQGGKTP